jgi:hypothetical protein
MGSNPSTVCWMDVSDLLAIIFKRNCKKGSQKGHTKKIFKNKELSSTTQRPDPGLKATMGLKSILGSTVKPGDEEKQVFSGHTI